jgi:hypothetical protein
MPACLHELHDEVDECPGCGGTEYRAVAFHWMRTTKFDPVCAKLADRHYSRRKIGSPQFMPPGETIVLKTRCERAVWGWWRPHPDSGIKAMNGLDGWTCTIFRNESDILSSELVLDAELALHAARVSCGPSGLITYVFDKKVRSTNPGCCFRKAGWKRTGRSADGKKTLFQKPFIALPSPQLVLDLAA